MHRARSISFPADNDFVIGGMKMDELAGGESFSNPSNALEERRSHRRIKAVEVQKHPVIAGSISLRRFPEIFVDYPEPFDTFAHL